ncbi:putative transcription factor interactor and regulator CCHC(Zn) family [Helianthus anomalus]
MLVVSGLREEYTGLKTNILTRQFPTAFSELHGLLADHDYMIKKSVPEVSPVQAFMAASTNFPDLNNTSASSTNIQALQQLVSQLGFQLQPVTQQPLQKSPQAFYTNSPGNSHGRAQNNRRGRGNQYNRGQGGGTRNQFPWASNQNTIFGTCNRCGIGHIPSQCPNRDPATLRGRQPSANYTDHRSQVSSSWLPDTGSNEHSAPDLSSIDYPEPYRGNDGLHVGNGQVYTHYPPHGSKP